MSANISVPGSCQSVVTRDNVTWGTAIQMVATTAEGLDISTEDVYRNKCYSTSSGSRWLDWGTVTFRKFVALNSVYYTTNNSPMLRLPFSNFQSPSGSDFPTSEIDYNNYYFPNSAFMSNNIDGGGGNKNFAQWQAAGTGTGSTHTFDPHGTNQDPGWIDPANGNFNT